MLAMIVGLGLIHGLGLSTRLQQLPLNEDQLLMNIISFNVGIELGQITALTLMLFLIAAFRKSQSFPTFSTIANYTLVLAGGFLFFIQMHGYEHAANAEEFTATIEPVKNDNIPDVTQTSDWKDTIIITIPARGDKEYKLLLAKGDRLEYLWKTNKAELFFDFHGEPAGDTTGYFKSYAKNTNNQAGGSLTTSFAGTHGWYWKNSSTAPVTITLNIKGDYQRLDIKQESIQASLSTTHDSIDSLF